VVLGCAGLDHHRCSAFSNHPIGKVRFLWQVPAGVNVSEDAVGIVKHGLRHTRKPRTLASQTGLRRTRTLVAQEVALRNVVAAEKQPLRSVHTAHQHPVPKQSVDLREARLEHCRQQFVLVVLAGANGH